MEKTNKRSLDLKTTNESIQSMTKQIGENSDWIKENLAKLWGENQADYYANPSRYVNHEANVPANEPPSAKSKHLQSRKSKTEQLSNADQNHDSWLDASQKSQHAKKMFRFSNTDDSNKHNKSMKNSQKSSSSSSLMTGAATAATTTTGANPNNRGLYAYTIWENIRESSTNRLKQFDLDKELKETMDTFVRSKEKESIIKSKTKPKVDQEERQLLKDIEAAKECELDMDVDNRTVELALNESYDGNQILEKLKRTKVFRNELELMYRSSKMNEDRAKLLSGNSACLSLTLPQLESQRTKDSIVNYLPPSLNQELTQSEDTFNINSNKQTYDLIMSPLNRHKYRQELEKKTHEKSATVDYLMIKNRSSSQESSRPHVKNVKLTFLADKSSQISTDIVQNRLNGTKVDNTFDELDEKLRTKSTGPLSQNNVKDARVSVFPPLTMNALVEYHPLVKAPGLGDFENGRAKMFKIKN